MADIENGTTTTIVVEDAPVEKSSPVKRKSEAEADSPAKKVLKTGEVEVVEEAPKEVVEAEADNEIAPRPKTPTPHDAVAEPAKAEGEPVNVENGKADAENGKVDAENGEAGAAETDGNTDEVKANDSTDGKLAEEQTEAAAEATA